MPVTATLVREPTKGVAEFFVTVLFCLPPKRIRGPAAPLNSTLTFDSAGDAAQEAGGPRFGLWGAPLSVGGLAWF